MTDSLPEVDCLGLGPFHARHAAETLGMNFTREPKSPYRYYIGNFHNHDVKGFLSPGRVRVVHWIGSDVLDAYRTGNFYRDCIHWCDWYSTQPELLKLGVKAEVFVHQPLHVFKAPIPLEGDAVAVYSLREMYHPELLEKVTERLAPREVIQLPRPGFPRQMPDISDVFRRCSHYLRIIDHDGFSHLAAEFMLAGRSVVTNQVRPYQYQVDGSDLDWIVDALSYPPYPEAPAFYRDVTDPRHIIRRWRELMENS